MALFIKQDEDRSRIQTKIAADLAERMNKKPIEEKKVAPAFLDDQKKTTGLAWVWMALLVVGLIAFVFFVMLNQYKN